MATSKTSSDFFDINLLSYPLFLNSNQSAHQEKALIKMRVDLTDSVETPPLPSKVKTAEQPYEHLDGFSRPLANLVSRPVVLVYGLIVPLAVLAWVWMFLAAQGIASSNQGGSLGPSMQLLEPLLRKMDIATNSGWIAYLVAICTPSSFSSAVTVQSFSTMFVMWLVMVVAMMLPSAAPMLRTYAGIADTAAKKGEKPVPVTILAAGYLMIWTGFALQATLLQAAMIAAGTTGDPSAPVTGMIGGGVLILAGLYQFTPLKNACLVRCRNPYSVIFEQWSTRRGEVFKLGLQQGWFCLGCCWAIMLVMITVGTMNLVWMVFLTMFTLLEKTLTGYAATRIFGVVLLAWGSFLVLSSLTASV
jgi:predicted metal-binding membrane protein